MVKVIISTVYSGHAIKVALSKLGADKLILVTDDIAHPTKDSAIAELKQVFKDVLKIENLKIISYNLSEIAETVTEKIDKEFKEGNEILLHLSEGRKTTFLALLFAGFLRKDKIKGAYYITEENNNLINLPLIEFSIGETKKEILKQIKHGNGIAKDLKEKLEVNQSAVYQHLQELKKEGYISNEEEGLKLTDLGRIIIL